MGTLTNVPDTIRCVKNAVMLTRRFLGTKPLFEDGVLLRMAERDRTALCVDLFGIEADLRQGALCLAYRHANRLYGYTSFMTHFLLAP